MLENKVVRFLIFLGANFLALGVGVLLMQNGPQTDWYINLNKAPWSPPNWMFGVAWTLIMICFSFYMTQLSFKYELFNKQLLTFFSLQWLLNVGWNYAFFNQHFTILGLVIITALLALICFFMLNFKKKIKTATLLIVPYFVWMVIATSLNAYIVFNN